LGKYALYILSLSGSFNALAVEPYAWAGTLTLESIANLKGGIATGTRQSADLDLTLNLDTQAAGWWSGGEWFLYFLGTHGRNPSDLVGDIQTLSNIAAPNDAKLYEFWYKHSFAEGRLELLVGLQDYNANFYTLETASLFSLSSFGIGAEVAQASPSIFPTTATGIQLRYSAANSYLQLAVYDGIPGDPSQETGTHIKWEDGDGLFSALEWGLERSGAYKLALGAWRQSATLASPVIAAGDDYNSGYYLIGEKYVAEDIAVFVQLGYADEMQNLLGRYLGGGGRINNLWRSADALGLAVAKASNSAAYLRENPSLLDAETVWELSYFTALDDGFSLQSSLYYVKQPSMDVALDSAIALGARIYWDF
jgi:porin